MEQYNLFDIIDKNLQAKEQEMEVKRIDRNDCKDFILNKHYAQRMPLISYAYGLIKKGELIGVCTIGKPASNNLCVGILGEKYSKKVFELNRLITLDNLDKNILSYFVGQVLKDLKKDNLIIVSYADEGAGHCGYIYQATNFIYTGATKKRLEFYIPNGKHSRNHNKETKEKYKNIRMVRTVKHRYVYFACDKKHKKEYMSNLKYKIEPYPKKVNKNYVLGTKIKRTVVNTENGESWEE